ncbi:phage minor capsid protein [Nocardia farcinica]|uniref:Putative phage protein n=1 Tax=Nocardia farcinica (strain IFM 10152) TaxID=247156 RepID=Q5YSR4_NOCFA|nr:phage minor capsid protein [Nocardia farcinica]BAD58777.1 putative phage protein [Nocardia farcinica IFM 10152]
MPLTPSYGDRRAGPVVRLYRRTERRLLELLAKTIAPGVGHLAVWALRLLMRLTRFRGDVATILDDTDRELPARLQEALTAAWRDGTTVARTDLPGPHAAADERALQRLIADTLASVRSTHQHVPRVMESAYRRIIDEAVRAEQTSGPAARARAVHRALNAFARQGITGFVDARGRRYDLVSYVEIAVRSAITRAEVDAYCAQAQADGHDLVIVSDVTGACELCRPFEGQVLSISGATVGAVSRAASNGRPVAVTVLCSIAEARARGLWHPGCRHTITVWTPDSPTPPRAVRRSEASRAASRRKFTADRATRARERAALVAAAAEPSRRKPVAASTPDRMSANGGGGGGNGASGGNANQPASPFDDAATPQEVGARLAQLHNLRVFGFDDGVELHAAQELARAIHDMMTKYPDADLESVGFRALDEAPTDYGVTYPDRSDDGTRRYARELAINIRYARDSRELGGVSK